MFAECSSGDSTNRALRGLLCVPVHSLRVASRNREPALEKAGADARAVAAALRAQGHDILTAIDAPRREMNRRIAEFTHRLEPGDTAFVFFAGHGVEIDGENYLLPTDIVVPNSGERDFIKSESIALSELLDRVRGTATALDAFLDRYGDRKDEFTVRMALEMRSALDQTTPEPAQRVIAPVTPAPAPTGRTRTDIVRDTQNALNAAGCSAGGADGVPGRRTRSAFERLMQAASLTTDSALIGTEAGLEAVKKASARGIACPVEVAQPAPPPAPAQQAGAAQPPAAAPINFSLAGTWYVSAKCTVVLKVTSTVRFRSVGGSHYSGTFANSLGQTGNSDVYLNGRDYSATDYLPGAIFKTWGKMSADGSSITGSSSSTCSFYMRRG